jgi:hypothetical protein
MGLTITGVNIKTKDGDDLTSFYIDIASSLTEKPSPKIIVELRPYRSEADLDAGFRTLQLYDSGQGLATDVPQQLRTIVDGLTAVQYGNVDMAQVHNQLAALLEQGDAHARWDELIGADTVWAGFGATTVAVDLPA